jgi:hypothetical protein
MRAPSRPCGPARWIAIALLAWIPSLAGAAPCAGFVDVDAASAFCPNVEWLKNRSITLGCGPGTYCPTDAVSRLSMAAFMNRLGDALTPTALRVDLAPGALDLDASPVICQSPAFDVTGYPRRAIVDIAVTGRASADTTFATTPVLSVDGGASWTSLAQIAARTQVGATRWRGVSHFAHAALDVGTQFRFGVRVDRGGSAGTVDLVDSRCQLRVLIFSRDGTSPPY